MVEELRAAVRHRRGLVADRKKAQQRLHDQLNALCPGLSAPAGHGRSLSIETPTGQAVLACAVAFAGRAPSTRSLIARSPGKLTKATAEYWTSRWRDCLAPPLDATARAERLGRDLERYRRLLVDVAAVEDEIAVLLARTDGQILTSLPGVATNRAAAFAAHSLPIARFPDAEHLYSATGLAPAMYESATIRRRGRISRQGLAEHRDALMGIAWGLSLYSPTFADRHASFVGGGRGAETGEHVDHVRDRHHHVEVGTVALVGEVAHVRPADHPAYVGTSTDPAGWPRLGLTRCVRGATRRTACSLA